MAGARGDALDWALALARAPGERMALRQQPLPDGMEPLLQIATGNRGEALTVAIERTGATDTELVDAVRFYLREVLFHSGADAYRVLGLARDASAEQVKTHHRLLQQWLHPDRQTSDWDAIFAGRVNAAWSALRTPEQRAAYDAAHPVATTSSRWSTRSAPRVAAPVPLEVHDAGDRWRRRAPILALFAACAVLGTIALRDALREPESGYIVEAADTDSAAPDEADAVALRMPRRATSDTAAPERKPAAAPQRAIARTPPPAQDAYEPDVIAALDPIPMPETPSRSELPPPAVPPPPAAPPRALVTPQPETPPPVMAAAPRVTAAPMPAVAAQAKVPAPPPQPATQAPATMPAAPSSAVTAVAPAPTVASVERVRQAQRTGGQLLAFLASSTARTPPIWDSMAAQERALRLRERLHASGGRLGGDPQWRVDREDASLQAAFGDDAQVRAQLVWREQRWLVSGVALEGQP